MNQYINDIDFLSELYSQPSLTKQYKINLLSFNESIEQSLESNIIGGSINIDGSSNLRRSGNLDLVFSTQDEYNNFVSQINSLNKKISIEVGVVNNLKAQYPQYKDTPIIWEPMGVFVIIGYTTSKDVSGEKKISIQIQDKMCLLNGTCGGIFGNEMILDEEKNDQGVISQIPIIDVIQTLLIDQGKEQSHNIIIKDLPEKIKHVVKWMGSQLFFLRNDYQDCKIANSRSDLENNGKDYTMSFVPGQDIGYVYDNLVYTGEKLIAEAGTNICSILDKIRDYLGNYEYYYDVYGRFIFQEIPNYLNIKITSSFFNNTNLNSYPDKTVFKFTNNKIITSVSINPDWSNIKNDFYIWGKQNDLPIRYHATLDKKPSSSSMTEYRNYIYQYGENDSNYNYYWRELKNEWPKLWDIDANDWKDSIKSNISNIDYWLDIITPVDESLQQLQINELGYKRTLVYSNDKINCIFGEGAPPVIYHYNKDPNNSTDQDWYVLPDNQQLLPSDQPGYTAVQIGIGNKGILSQIIVGGIENSAYDYFIMILNQSLRSNKALSLNCQPLYFLEANRLISLNNGLTDERNEKEYTNYLISSISYSFGGDGDSMSISASKMIDRI